MFAEQNCHCCVYQLVGGEQSAVASGSSVAMEIDEQLARLEALEGLRREVIGERLDGAA